MHKIRCLNTLLLGLFFVPKPAEAQFNLNPATCALVKLLRDNDVDEIVGYRRWCFDPANFGNLLFLAAAAI